MLYSMLSDFVVVVDDDFFCDEWFRIYVYMCITDWWCISFCPSSSSHRHRFLILCISVFFVLFIRWMFLYFLKFQAWRWLNENGFFSAKNVVLVSYIFSGATREWQKNTVKIVCNWVQMLNLMRMGDSVLCIAKHLVKEFNTTYYFFLFVAVKTFFFLFCLFEFPFYWLQLF